MANDKIIIRGAREHNLKNIDLTIPRDKLIVFTGVSGSGKSSLAFDTIYAEGQRRYMESLSSYARMFLGQMEKPNVDGIEGLSPSISIAQKTTSKNPRSTVGTVTEIYDYLRSLYANIGIPHCPVCGREISQQTIDQIVDRIKELGEGTRIQILAPIARGRKGEYAKELESIRKQGFVRVRIDGEMRDLSEDIKLKKNIKHDIEVVVDRLSVKPDMEARLSDSLETAGKLTEGLIYIDVVGGEELHFSQNYSCPEHNISIDALEPKMFSFNNPYGACPACTGLGVFHRVDPDLIIPDKSKSIQDGAINACGWNSLNDNSIAMMYYRAISSTYNIPLDVPVSELSQEQLDKFLYGTGDERIKIDMLDSFGGGYSYHHFEGVVNNLERRYKDGTDSARAEIENYMHDTLCPECRGERLKKEALSVTINGKNISDFCKMSIEQAIEFMRNINLTQRELMIGGQMIKEIKARLNFLKRVGLEYLTLSRSACSLSGGESQRIRLATQIGSFLMGVIYILDEPSIGLHQRDNDKLISTLENLRDIGNTVIVVEHDEDTMRAADYIVDIGPGAGTRGGEVVCAGTAEEIMKCRNSATGEYLSGRTKIPVPGTRRKPDGRWLKIVGAQENNLKNINVSIPLGVFTCVTGVSGSGKSSLINQILYNHLAAVLNRARTHTGKCKEILGTEHLDKIIAIDQAPIGRTPRSNPATYTGVFTDIRDLFASTNDAKMKGYGTARFSFNVKGGRCEACQGDGIIKIEMHFLPDVYVPCDVCKGRRYNRETLEVRYKGKNIYDVLQMTIEEGCKFFENVPKIYRKLKTLCDVGLGYVQIGQPATTLSGGEAQRVKLATELSKRATGRTVYILDEPTTGLHTADVHKLIEVLSQLVEGGNTVIVIEHNLDVIKTADYIIDLGPEGGDKGGTLIACGTPEEIAEVKLSYTGQYLKKILIN